MLTPSEFLKRANAKVEDAAVKLAASQAYLRQARSQAAETKIEFENQQNENMGVCDSGGAVFDRTSGDKLADRCTL